MLEHESQDLIPESLFSAPISTASGEIFTALLLSSNNYSTSAPKIGFPAAF